MTTTHVVMVARKTKSVPYRPVVRHSRAGARKLPGLYVRHQASCPAYLPADASRKCRCRPYFKPRYASKWGPTFRDEASAMPALAVMKKGTPAIRERSAAGWSFGTGSDAWLEGVSSGDIKRRRRGRAEPYSESTLPDYRQIVRFLQDDLGLRDRLAKDIAVEEWWDIFEGLRRGHAARSGAPLSHSRRASIKSVASNVYAYMSQRGLQTRTGITRNPLEDIDLGANNGQRRERVALPEEARELLDALDPLDRVAFALALYGGPRRQDIGRLDWTDISFLTTEAGNRLPGHWLHLRPLANARRGPGKVGEGRWIPMAPQLRTVLLEEWQRQGRPAAGRICPRSVISGTLYERADRAWQTANMTKAEQLGRPLRGRGKHEAWGPEHELEPIRLHECRHTYCSWLVRSKRWDIDAMMAFMGQTQLSTFQRYVHTVQEHGPREALEPVDVFGDERATYEG
jgi:integrase